MALKFGQQLEQQRASENQQRLSRTERKIAYQEQQREKLKFQQLQQEAERLKQTEFVGLSIEEYTSKYNKLSPDLKPFFATPQEILARQQQQKAEQVDTANKTISQWQQELEGKKRRMEEYKTYYEEQSSDYKRRNKSNYLQAMREYQLSIQDYEEKIAQLKSQAPKIEQGYNAQEIIRYAEDKAYYKGLATEEKAKERKDYYSKVQSNNKNLGADLKTLGLDKSASYSAYKEKLVQQEQNRIYLQSVQVLVKKTGYEKAPQFAKEVINPEAQKWQKENPTEILQFDNEGNIIGVKSEVKTPEEVYSQWEKEISKKPYYLDFESKEITLPYETKGTINSMGNKNKFYPIFLESKKEEGVFSKFTNKYNQIMSKTGDIEIPLMGVARPIKLKEVTLPIAKEFGNIGENLYKKMVENTPNSKELESQFQEENQVRFEREYMKKIIFNDVSSEQASKEFESGKTSSLIQEKYSKAITEDSIKMPILNKWAYGSGIIGANIGKKAFEFIPTNYGDLTVKSTLVYTGFKVINYIPKSVNLGITGGTFAYGSFEAFNPKSTPVQAGSGLITATITGTALGYDLMKYLKSPVIKYKSVPAKRISLESSQTYGRDVIFQYDDKAVNRVFYGEQKLSQTVREGRRTIVTTKWRELMNKYLKTNFKNIYEGIPYQQKAIYGTDVFRGGRYKVVESGYDRALKKLMEYGYTKSEAQRTLRFYKPIDISQTLKIGEINIINDKYATGRFIFETKYNVYDVGGGIKTRGGRTIQEIVPLKRTIIEEGNKQIVLERKDFVSYYLNKKGLPVKLRNYGTAYSKLRVGVSDEQKGIELIGTRKGMAIYKEPSTYKDLIAISRETKSITITPKRKNTIVSILDERKRIAYDIRKTTLFDYEYDLRSKQGEATIIQKGTKPLTGKALNTKVSQVVNKISEKKGILNLKSKLDISNIIDNKQTSSLYF